MTHRLSGNVPKPRAVIGTPWFIRKAIYAVATIIGLAAVVLGWAQPDQVDQWVTQAGSLAAIIGGGMAAMNTGWESDEARRRGYRPRSFLCSTVRSRRVHGLPRRGAPCRLTTYPPNTSLRHDVCGAGAWVTHPRSSSSD